MRITCTAFLLALVLLGTQFAVAGQTKYGVTVRTIKPAELAKVKTYAWRTNQPSFIKNVNDAIVAAIDRELTARGLTKVASGQNDVLVTYASNSRTDVDTRNNAATTGAGREFDVGVLSIDLTSVANNDLLFRVRVDTPIERDAAALEMTINSSVKAMFEKYPSPAKR
jgi:hypothetical protein